MAIHLMRVQRSMGIILVVVGFAAGAAMADGQSQAPSKPAPPAPTHWGYYEPPPAPPPAAKPAPKAQPKGATTLKGAQTTGNQVQTTVATTSSSGSGGSSSSLVVSVPGVNGGSKTLVDQSEETIQLNANTTRTIKRIYGQGPDGKRQLIAIQQTDVSDLGNGKSKQVSTLKQRNADGNFDLVRKATGETVPAGQDATRTSLTVFTPGMSGEMTPSQKTEEIQHTTKTGSTTTTTDLVPDGNGGWMTGKKTETVVDRQANGQQTQEKKIFAPDANGNLSLAQRQVTRDWKTNDGQEHQEVSTYDPAPAGTLTSQGPQLTLSSQVTTTKAIQADGTVKTTEQTAQSSAVSANGKLSVTGSVIQVDSPTKTGPMQVQRTVYADDGNGQLRQISVFGGETPKPTPAQASKPEPKKPESAKNPKGSQPAAKKTPPAKPHS